MEWLFVCFWYFRLKTYAISIALEGSGQHDYTEEQYETLIDLMKDNQGLAAPSINTHRHTSMPRFGTEGFLARLLCVGSVNNNQPLHNEQWIQMPKKLYVYVQII